MKRIIKIALLSLGIIVSFVIIQQLVQYFPIENLLEEVVLPSNKFEKGAIHEYYGDSTLKLIERFEKGVLSGKSVYYYPNGKIERISYFKNGVKTGYEYHFANDGSLVYMVKYSFGEVVEENIINDSLYKYDLQIVEHGRLTFKNNCGHCHNNGLRNLTNELQILKDTLKTGLISIDSLHYIFADSIKYEPSFIDSLYANNDSLDLNDIHAVIKYIDQKNQKRTFPVVKQLKVRSKRI